MATSLQSHRSSASIVAEIRPSPQIDNGVAAAQVSHKYVAELDNGTGSGNANSVFTDERTLAGVTSEDLDLAASLADAFGQTKTFTKVKEIMIEHRGTSGNIEVGGAATNQFLGILKAATDKIILQPGGCFYWSDPVGATVTAGTSDLLKVNNLGAGAQNYRITIVGEA